MTAGPLQLDAQLVRALLAEQHPDLAGLPVERVAEGWDNTVFRVGSDLTARLPRRTEGVALVRHEQRWVPELLADLPAVADGGLATSSPLRTGVAGCGYPWPWSVGPWLPGAIAARSTIADPFDAAGRLGRFLAAFHRGAPVDAPANPYRGVPLADRSVKLAEGLDRIAAEGLALGPGVDRSMVEARWAALVGTPAWDRAPQWIHGDLHLANLLVDGGVLSGVLDFGDLTAGDPATDLSVAWPLLPAAARPAFRTAAAGAAIWAGAGIDPDTWRRAEAWALCLAVALLAGSTTTNPLRAVARHTLRTLLLDDER
ncbi:aminoglycoside phosphotransferase family protein [Aquihabitans sp. G128]|uniref:aminoglycoside phosphotransferase family protein n=1 Tax=Aquihabitans sp. G128 TaxID=2849779 RepID=UPI001C21EE43|nr:aminoglycoside phosphotransferase family protein [Aquihabitans sp. G128]QXC62132.1 aminoglycoside phosphotransferase family protein [Aquihabitans sp. G128]